MAKRGNVICSVQKLGYANSASSPVSSRQSMLESLSYYSRANCHRHVNYGTFHTYTFKLVLYVASQVSKSHAEKVCEKRTSKSQAFVLEVVFVVCLSSSKFQLNGSKCHFA